MIKPAVILVILIFLFTIFWILAAGYSSLTYFPGIRGLYIDSENPSIARFPFTSDLDGMKKICMELPSFFRRRPVELTLLDGAGTAAATILPDEKTSKRSLRVYYLDPPIEESRGEDYTLEIAFSDGPVQTEGTDAAVFDDLAITFEYNLDAAFIFRNLGLFKPFPLPLLFMGILLLLYGYAASTLLGLFFPRRIETGADVP